MNAWEPITEAEIRELIQAARERMTEPQRRFWEAVRIEPVKWQQDPYGTEGRGFWAVGIYGRRVIWFNDIEIGFNLSSWTTSGVLGDYGCNQDQLEWSVGYAMDEGRIPE